MKRWSDQEHEWLKIMVTSIDAKELMKTAEKLDMNPLTVEKAKELVELNKEVLSLGIE